MNYMTPLLTALPFAMLAALQAQEPLGKRIETGNSQMAVAPASAGKSAQAESSLEEDFASPPDGTKPRCYWYWMYGKISKEGITHDLEAMKRIGIGEGYIGIINGGRELKALSEEWWQLVEHAVREGGRLGVDIGIFNSPGWSQSGGPWVKPSQAMRYVVMPEVRLHGPQHFAGKLPVPVGDFQDISVLAFPAPAGDTNTIATHSPKVMCVPEAKDAGKLFDGDIGKAVDLPAGQLTVEVAEAFTARSLTIYPVTKVDVQCELMVSDDGQQFRSVRKFVIDRHNLSISVGPVPLSPVSITFPAVKAKYFRLVFPSACTLGEIGLSSAARVESFAEKQLAKLFQGSQAPFDAYMWAQQPEPDSADLIVKADAVQDISKKMSADGTLSWDVPAGDWIVQRMAIRPTGSRNSPAPPEATGLEVDKMSREALKGHFDAYVGKLLDRVPKAERKALKHVVADSYETGPQNWTDDMAKDFAKRYGYDPMPYLPVMSGRVVGSVDQSDRFLWDMRRMVADRVACDYVGGLRDLSAANGLKLWLENYGHWGFPGEFLQYGGHSDEISGEFWEAGHLGTCELRPASSVAHIYGKKQVFAEAFTGGPRFTSTPWSLKKRGDWALCQGINQFVLHVYIHQPWDDRFPGVNAGFGTEFNRNNTWFEASKSWIDYHRRCSVLLQQGQPVADVAYFIGEDAPRAFGGRNPELPPGYDFDYINAEVLLTRATAKDGRLVLASGMSYKVLVLPAQDTMTPELLAKIAELAKAGVAVCGPRPVRSPSMKNFAACDQRLKALAAELWDKGLIPPSADLKAVLERTQTPPDLDGVDFKKFLFTHRRTADADFYFLSNQTDAPVDLTPSFRVTGRAPELWDAVSGGRERLALYEVGAISTRVPLRLEARGSVFVVFRGKAAADSLVSVKCDGQPCLLAPGEVTRSDEGKLVVQTCQPGRYEFTTAEGKTLGVTVAAPPAAQVIQGGWQVTFPGQAEPLPFAQLASWTEHADAAVKYFSGTATYRTTFDMPSVSTGQRHILDLGQVESLAEVTLNGRKFAWLWQPPYRVDITDALKPVSNALQVRVVNTWHNRLLGQQQEPAAFSAPGALKPWLVNDYQPAKELKPAGLLGPVRVLPIPTAVAPK